jgi:hypothetical protein
VARGRPERSDHGGALGCRGKLSDGAQGRALVGRCSEQGAGCSHDFRPLEEALADGGTTKQSSGEERHGAEGK